MTIKYTLVESGEQRSIVVRVDGRMEVATSDHPAFDAIVEAARVGDEQIIDLFNVATAITTKFERVTDRVTVRDDVVYFDNDAVNNDLTAHMLRVLSAGKDVTPVAKFWENLASNPSAHSREQLFRWIKDRNLTIDEDGYIVAYKGVNVDEDGNYVSATAGPAVVNNVPVNGFVPNAVGNVVEMARSSVVHNPAVGCSVGLHAGTYDYASTFTSGPTLEVRINPRDVVSVPTDCYDSKMRVSRYVVAGVVEEEVSEPLVPSFPVATDTRQNYKRMTRDSRGRFVASK
jgi:hypothetical protein